MIAGNAIKKRCVSLLTGLGAEKIEFGDTASSCQREGTPGAEWGHLRVPEIMTNTMQETQSRGN